jgi:hypothetical protein
MSLRGGGAGASTMPTGSRSDSQSLPSSSASEIKDIRFEDKRRTGNISLKRSSILIASDIVDIGERTISDILSKQTFGKSTSITEASRGSKSSTKDVSVTGGKHASIGTSDSIISIIGGGDNGKAVFHCSNSTTDSPTDIFKLCSFSTGTPAIGIGTGIEFGVHTSGTGTSPTSKSGAFIQAIATNITSSSEDIDMIFKTMGSGNTASEALRITSSNDLTVQGNITCGVDSDGSDRTITFGHTTLKTIMGIDDSSNRFTINTDSTFDGTPDNNSLTLDSSHNLTIAGDIKAFATSDERLKQNVIPIQCPLDKIKKLGGYTFEWIPQKDIHSNTGTDVGVLAQEVENVFPDVVTTRSNGYKAVKYQKLIPLLIESIKTLSEKVERLEEQLIKKNN